MQIKYAYASTIAQLEAAVQALIDEGYTVPVGGPTFSDLGKSFVQAMAVPADEEPAVNLIVVDAAGPIPLTHATAVLDVGDAPVEFTLPDGTNGHRIRLLSMSAEADTVVGVFAASDETAAGDTLTFDGVNGSHVDLEWYGSAWWVIAANGAALSDSEA